jgi:gas vesicle protein
MKIIVKLGLSVLLSMFSLVGTIRAADGSGTGPTAGPTPPPGGTSIRPETAPAEVKAAMERFQQEREAYLAREKALAEKLKSATEDQRVKIREQMKDLADKWAEQSRELRRKFADRLNDLKTELSEKKKALLDAAKDKNDRRKK